MRRFLNSIGIYFLQILVPLLLDKDKLPTGQYDLIAIPREDVNQYIDIMRCVMRSKTIGMTKKKVTELYNNAVNVTSGKVNPLVTQLIDEIYDSRTNYYVSYMEIKE